MIKLTNVCLTRFHCGLRTYIDERMFDFDSVIAQLEAIDELNMELYAELHKHPQLDCTSPSDEDYWLSIEKPVAAIENITYKVVASSDDKFKAVYVYGDVTALTSEASDLLESGKFKFNYRTITRADTRFRMELIKLIAFDLTHK